MTIACKREIRIFFLKSRALSCSLILQCWIEKLKPSQGLKSRQLGRVTPVKSPKVLVSHHFAGARKYLSLEWLVGWGVGWMQPFLLSLITSFLSTAGHFSLLNESAIRNCKGSNVFSILQYLPIWYSIFWASTSVAGANMLHGECEGDLIPGAYRSLKQDKVTELGEGK